ncbi:hypothetical protein CGLO_01759 [Colletotrichum gloeosporioides Cg-14]|uniref:Transmembrane protein n=1 Tax=Colletotrichum gloeosporioides (strain Cg-14) TaxID=1237896 RepID=T0MAX6_COLGC|nr:hypothetical protein CGLO_01759 [Colletotrichum gloeosporioides Cg-14]
MYKPKASRHPMIYSKENEWAIIDDEEEEEKERQRLRQAERLKVGCFVAALTVVLVPTICGFANRGPLKKTSFEDRSVHD